MNADRAIQFVSPLLPLRTGIAQYSRDLLKAIDGRWPMQVIPEDGSTISSDLRCDIIDPGQFDPQHPTILQLGNSEFHRRAFEIGLGTSGIAVLHDVVLHHGLLAVALSERNMPDYWRELWHRYGSEGYRAGQALLRGTPVEAIAYPLSEQFIERAQLTVVHNQFAKRIVEELVPRARVMRVPMGIPLPPLVERDDARRALGWPVSAFIVASISHVNPNKRLPVVLRAIKRLSARLPETVFVIAGSRSPAVDVERHVRALGLRDRVIVSGYVEDQQARLIAAAADACVNLRHPPSGETSASLLRLLGAGKPVLVSDGPASEDLPPDVGLRVPVDRLEEEFIADLLFELAQNDELRDLAGQEARRFVEDCHSMGAAIEGYRNAIAEAFGIDLPVLGPLAPREPVPELTIASGVGDHAAYSSFDCGVAAALSQLGLGEHALLLADIGQATVELGLDRLPKQAKTSSWTDNGSRQMSERLISRLICPRCGGVLGKQEQRLTCRDCGAGWRGNGGVANLVEQIGKRRSDPNIRSGDVVILVRDDSRLRN